LIDILLLFGALLAALALSAVAGIVILFNAILSGSVSDYSKKDLESLYKKSVYPVVIVAFAITITITFVALFFHIAEDEIWIWRMITGTAMVVYGGVFVLFYYIGRKISKYGKRDSEAIVR